MPFLNNPRCEINYLFPCKIFFLLPRNDNKDGIYCFCRCYECVLREFFLFGKSEIKENGKGF